MNKRNISGQKSSRSFFSSKFSASNSRHRTVRKNQRFDFQSLEPRHLLAAVNGFFLVNADSDADIGPLTDGATIDIQSLSTSNLNVRATTDEPVGSVRLDLSGPSAAGRTESVAPYALFGDNSGDYFDGSFSAGQYTLVATPYSGTNLSGTAGTPLTISFDVVNDVPEPPVVPPSGSYIEQNGLVIMEAENTLSDLGLWREQTQYSNFTGDSYLQFTGNSTASGPPNSPLEYKFIINTPGLYYLDMRMARDTTNGQPSDHSNDAYVRVEGDYGPGPNPGNTHGANAPLSMLRSNTKFFGGAANSFVWASGNRLDPGGHNNKRVAIYDFKAGEEYTLVVSGRSKFFSLDRIMFRHVDENTSNARNLNNPESPQGALKIAGELKKWHKTTISFDGPLTSETASNNPFLNYRLDVTFSHAASGKTYVVPGYYAADGNAANSGATSGDKWKVHFSPDETGTWTYTASFRAGNNVAIADNPLAGSSGGFFDGETGQFEISDSDKTGDDNRAKGRLEYVGERYLQYAETGEYFIKQGPDAPENLLAYDDFDGPFANDGQRDQYIKDWAPHVSDWNNGDPTWDGDKGKGLIGAINYLASEDLNSISFLTNNIGGDDRNVFPYLNYNERLRMDISRLDQWEIVFEHADSKGMYLHFKTQETENDQMLDGGALGNQRKLYYRELIARFSHHLALNWNIGEENTNTNQQRKDFAEFFKDLDPYDHNIVVHTFPNQKSQVYTPLLGNASDYTGASLQTGNGSFNEVFSDTLTWVNNSTNSGKPWVVAVDEPGNANDGLVPDNDNIAGTNQTNARKNALWGTLMAGGAGNEWYFGYQHDHSDLTLDDFRSRDRFWDYARYAKEFFTDFDMPFWEMANDNSVSSASNDYAFVKPGDTYAIYLKNGGSTNLNLNGITGAFDVRWFDPRNGGGLQEGSVTQVVGGSSVSLGQAPSSTGQDWAILVTRGELIVPPEIMLFARDGQTVENIHMLDRPDRLQTLSIAFDQPVDVGSSDLTMTQVATGESVNLSIATFDYNPVSRLATWDLGSFSDFLPAGYYNLTVSAGGVTTTETGTGMTEDYSVQVYKAIPGDANLDGKVDVYGDGLALIQHIGMAENAKWMQGDFNGDGEVDIAEDGVVLLENLNKSVTAVVETASATALAPPNATSVNRQRDIAFTHVDYAWADSDEDKENSPASASTDGSNGSLESGESELSLQLS